MDKYLVFRLQKWQRVNVNLVPDFYKEAVQAIYRPPVLEDKLVPCFELVKEFDIPNGQVSEEVYWEMADRYASQYSLNNKVRTLVVKGSVFGD